MKQLFGISLALVMLFGSVPLGFSEPIKVQIEQGIETDQLQCDNDSHVLVQRNNGNMACVSERTADRMGWEIINEFKIQVVPSKPEPIPQSEPIPTEAQALESTTVKEIPNPTGYWVPIPEEDREDFAKKFANATSDEITEYTSKNKIKTEKGAIHFSDNVVIATGYFNEVQYDAFVDKMDSDDMEEFIKKFMEKMGFEYGVDDVEEILLSGSSTVYFLSNSDYGYVHIYFYYFYDQTKIKSALMVGLMILI